MELIEEKGILSVEDVKSMQMDQVSILARETMRALEGIEPDDPDLLPIFQLFRDWDGQLSATSQQAGIYEVFTRLFAVNITRPKLGELASRYARKGPTPVLAELTMFGEHSREWLLTVLSDSQSPCCYRERNCSHQLRIQRDRMGRV